MTYSDFNISVVDGLRISKYAELCNAIVPIFFPQVFYL